MIHAARQSEAATDSSSKSQRFPVLILAPLVIAAMAATYARLAISPLQEAMKAGLALSDNQIALLQGLALALPISLAALPLGIAIDRYKRVRLLLIFAALTTAGSVLTSLAPNFNVLFAARSLVGLGTIATAMTVPSLIADLCPQASRGRAMILLGVGQVIGRSIAFTAGGALLSLAGTEVDGWQTTMLWMSLPLLPIIVLVLTLREPLRAETARGHAAVEGSFTQFWKHRALIAPVLLGFVVAEMADAAALVWAAPIFSRSFNLRPDEIGWIMGTVLLVSGVVGMFAGGFVADYCQRSDGPRRSILIMSGLAVLSIPAGCFAIVPGIMWAGLLLALLIAIGSIIAVMSATLFVVVIPNELRGLCFGAAQLANTLFCTALAPLLVSLLSGAWGGPGALEKSLTLVCVVTSVVSAIAFAAGRKIPLHLMHSK